MARPRLKERTSTYFDVKKACEIYLKNNTNVKSFNIVDLHKAYLKANPNNYVSYQTFINWNKKGFKQLEVFISISKIVGCTMCDLLTKPKK